MTFSRDQLIEIFNNTRALSNGKFLVETERAVDDSCTVINGSLYLTDKPDLKQTINFSKEGTVGACIYLHKGKTAALNFADALTPGGLVLDGVTTQEEDICRCSNLYETLIKYENKRDYYNYNYDKGDCESFSDRLIYSEGITIFKNENYELLDNPVTVDIITCPAPMHCGERSVFEQRIKCILGTAEEFGVETLILGAWGCGAFGNRPDIVASAFNKVLKNYHAVKNIIFAIRCTKNIPDENFDIFYECIDH
jgi:uncharacterized protein (TIGR02452 family)